MTIRIIVDTSEEKQQLLEASKIIHDSNLDSNVPMINTLMHLYKAPWLIEVDE